MPFDDFTIAEYWQGILTEEVAHWRKYLTAHSDAKGTMDFETRSACDLKKHGAHVYSLHPSTEAMCLSYKLPGYSQPKRWHMAHLQHLVAESPLPEDLFAFLLAGGIIEGHNSFFERMIWRNVMTSWPEIQHEQWRCSAAKACAATLPRSLEGATDALNLPLRKDMGGHKLMLKMSKPRKLRKAEIEAWCEETGWTGRRPAKDHPDLPIVYHEDEDDLYRLWSYCDGDVLAEEGLSDAIPDLSPYELRVWQMDQWINERGTQFDLELAQAALDMATAWKAKLNTELETMTGISSGTKRAAVKDWLLEHENLDLPDTKAATLEWYLEREQMSGRARRICEIITDVNRTSTRKYQSMLNTAGPDGRICGLLMYHGAGTGRWTGKNVQVHNFPARDLIVKDFDEAAEAIKSGDLDWCIALFGDIMKLLSHALRGAIIAPEGKDLMVADYASIEARNLLWLANAQSALDIFRRGKDIYCDMATGIYGFEVSETIAKDWTHPEYTLHSGCRQFGKQAVLGLGFGMGFLTFLLTCRKYKIYFSQKDALRIMGKADFLKYAKWVRDYLFPNAILIGADAETRRKYQNKKREAAKNRRRLTDEREDPKKIIHELALMKYTVDAYRARYPEVKQMWNDQETAAIEAVQSGEPIKCGHVTWLMEKGILYCVLPSGRRMPYRDATIKMVKTSWGELKPGLRYMSVNGVTRKWERTYTYGGKLAENITQAVARDILTSAILSAYEGGTYIPSFHVHDELICEVDTNEGSLKEFEALMSDIPSWADGCPITAEADRYRRYRK